MITENMWLFSYVNEDDVESVLFTTKVKATDHLTKNYSNYVKYAENIKEDCEYWRNPSNGSEGVIIEKLKIEE